MNGKVGEFNGLVADSLLSGISDFSTSLTGLTGSVETTEFADMHSSVKCSKKKLSLT